MTSISRRIRMAGVAGGFLVLGSIPAAAQGSQAPATYYPGRYPFTPADVHFVSGMIGHHAQAIMMAKWAPSHGASASIQVLCERIINAQQDEINLMQRWLADRKQPVPDATPMSMTMPMMPGMQHDSLMPGMLTDAQLKELDEARGVDFNRLFLMFMIQHHKGALTMVDRLFSSPGAGQDEAIYKMATDVYADQSTEIDRMQKMLITLPGN